MFIELISDWCQVDSYRFGKLESEGKKKFFLDSDHGNDKWKSHGHPYYLESRMLLDKTSICP